MTQAYGKQHSIHNFLYFFEVDVVVRVLQRNRTNRICIYLRERERERERDLFQELAHKTMETGKSGTYRVGCQTGDSRKS